MAHRSEKACVRPSRKIMRLLFSIAILFALGLTPARAASCDEGIQVIDQMSKILELSDLEQANIEALVTKAKLEEEQGRQRNCKIILADAIRFFLIKTVLE
jgi:hypothetical protein